MRDFIVFSLTGSFGLLTAAPVYLFLVLLPAVFFINLIQAFLLASGLFQRASLRIAGPLAAGGLSASSFLSVLMGFGCVTAALSSLAQENKRERIIGSAILCIAVPCSAQVAIIAAMIFLLNLPYIVFFFSFIILFTLLLVFLLGKLIPGNPPTPLCPLQPAPMKKTNPRPLIAAVLKSSVTFVLETAPVFLLGCFIVSVMLFTGVFAFICEAMQPYTADFLALPPEASSVLLLGLIKRDLSATAMLTIVRMGSFSQAEIVVCLIMLTFFVPCMASLAVLLRREKPAVSLSIWFGSLVIATIAGKIASLLIL